MIPEYAKAKSLAAIPNIKARFAWQSELVKCIAAEKTQDRKSALKKLKSQQKERQSSYELIRAVDHQLRLVGSSLGCFKPEGHYSQRLQPSERRDFVHFDKSKLPYELPPDSPPMMRCVVSREGKHMWDIPEFEGGLRPLLVFAGDQGGGLPSWLFALDSLKLRALPYFDPFHRTWRDWTLACQHSDLWPTIVETMCAMNLPHGPWLSESFFVQIQEASVDYHNNTGAEDMLFQAVYESIAFDKGRERDGDFGTDAHQQDMWRRIPDDRAFESKGERVTTKRWGSWARGMGTFLERWHTVLLTLSWIGLRLGFFESAEVCPVFGSSSAKIGVDIGQDKTPDSSSSDTAADRRIRELRSKCVNSIHLVAMILGDHSRYRKSRIIYTISRPILSTSPADVLKYNIAYAAGAYEFVLRHGWRLRECHIWREGIIELRRAGKPIRHESDVPSYCGRGGRLREGHVPLLLALGRRPQLEHVAPHALLPRRLRPPLEPLPWSCGPEACPQPSLLGRPSRRRRP